MSVSMREVLLANMYETEIDLLKKELNAALLTIDALRAALEKLASSHDDCGCAGFAREALQRAGGGE